jgi:hypothetical protein
MKWNFILIIFCGISVCSFGQSDTLLKDKALIPGSAVNKSGELQNSLKNFSSPWMNSISLVIENYYTSKIQGSTDVGNLMFLRGVLTTRRHAIRATLPIASVAAADGYQSGLGNFNILDNIRITGDKAKIHFGLGPLISAPTASTSRLGVKQWQFGFTSLLVYPSESGVLIGLLATYRNSISHFIQYGGYLTIQPALVIQLGNGFYGRSMGATTIFDFNNNRAIIPIGIGIGKLFKIGNSLGNIYIEPGYTVISKGKDIPAQVILMGIDFIWLRHKK